MFSPAQEVQSCRTLLTQYRSVAASGRRGRRILFQTQDKRDVYNITAPFADEGQPVIAGRVEGRDTEFSQVQFFVREGAEWVEANGNPRFELQDPFVSRMDGELVFGGVRVMTDPLQPERIVSWVTEFYRGQSVRTLQHFATGPVGMKDIRLVSLADGQIGVFTRPQGTVGGRGQIGYTTVPTLADVTTACMADAPLLEYGFLADEWGGCNELHLLTDGLIGVLGHIACFSTDGARHYYPITFLVDPQTARRSALQIIAERVDFPAGSAKHPDLVDVLFSGGLVNNRDGTADLYVGVSDAEAHHITIPDPFLAHR